MNGFIQGYYIPHIYTALFTLSIIANILNIGKPREPLSGGMVVANIIVVMPLYIWLILQVTT